VTLVEWIRKLLHRDWLCQGCWRQGTHRWVMEHVCPERDELAEQAQEIYRKHPGSWLF
jgi:hypothetical protein